MHAGTYLGIDVAIKEVLPSNDYDVSKYFEREWRLMKYVLIFPRPAQERLLTSALENADTRMWCCTWVFRAHLNPTGAFLLYQNS